MTFPANLPSDKVRYEDLKAVVLYLATVPRWFFLHSILNLCESIVYIAYVKIFDDSFSSRCSINTVHYT